MTNTKVCIQCGGDVQVENALCEYCQADQDAEMDGGPRRAPVDGLVNKMLAPHPSSLTMTLLVSGCWSQDPDDGLGLLGRRGPVVSTGDILALLDGRR